VSGSTGREEKNNHLPNMVIKNLNQTTIFSGQNQQALGIAIDTRDKSLPPPPFLSYTLCNGQFLSGTLQTLKFTDTKQLFF
jgi:hypothetical protein